ncbi:MAG: response regulator [Candidatus Magnetomorum sp.]|nr:response regulator [Candidatus Magnetomorum sp.]
MEKSILQVLVVDDELETVEILTGMVEAMGHEVTPFTDPYRAIQHFIKKPGDLVLTDLNMPHIDGFEMIKQMIKRQRTTQFIIITGEKSSTTVFQARNLNISALFFKPVFFDQLELAIQQVNQKKLYWIEKLQEVAKH